MHTRMIDTDEGRFVVQHNGDWSGHVHIYRPRLGFHHGPIDLPVKVIVELAGEMIRNAREERLENLEPWELMGLNRQP